MGPSLDAASLFSFSHPKPLVFTVPKGWPNPTVDEDGTQSWEYGVPFMFGVRETSRSIDQTEPCIFVL